jgi:hypothetical protein
MTSDDAFMAVAGLRYCLGRHSYAPILCCGWLKAKWPMFKDADRAVMLREIARHISDEEQSATQTWEVDLRTWIDFRDWAKSAPANPDREGKGGEHV